MASEAVVIGGGPGGLRAAAALARAGRRVVLLQEGPFPGGVGDAGIPVGRGVTPLPTGGSRAFVEGLVGPLTETTGLERAILHGTTVRALPLHRSALPAILPKAKVASAAVAWARTRGTVELKKLIGGGNEQRTYHDWIAQRHGEPVFEALYASYCRKRFGDPDEVSCNVARLYHGFAEAGPAVAPAAGASIVTPDALAGVEIRTNVVIRSIRTGAVETDQGEVTGAVYVDVPPARVAAWLDAGLSEELKFDLAQLRAKDGIQVLLGGGDTLPFETHVLDADVPFYRIVRPGLLPGCGALAGTVCVHFVADPGDTSSDTEWISRAAGGLAKAEIAGINAEGARVQRIPGQHPEWIGTHLVRMRSYLLALEEQEITPVGRAGLHSPLTLTAELAYLEAVLADEPASLREIARVHVEPPVMDPVDRTHLTRFVER